MKWCLDSNFIPVISPIGFGKNYQTFNINADTLAGSISSEISSERLIMLTDVKGVMDKKKNILTHISIKDVKKLISNGTISGGMIPKVETCVKAVQNGVKAAVILDGTSVGSDGNEARDATVGKDDGVFGAPKLDGFQFDKWTHEFVQSHLNEGWTMEQLQEKYEQEFGE